MVPLLCQIVIWNRLQEMKLFFYHLIFCSSFWRRIKFKIRMWNFRRFSLGLNSRPPFPMSNDPPYLSIFTSGHFLTLAPLSFFPEPTVTYTSLNRLHCWQLPQKIHQDLWKFWHYEQMNYGNNDINWTLSPT